MMALKERREPVRLFARRLFLLALLFLVFAAASGVWHIYGKERESETLRKEAELELRDLEARQAELRADIEKLQSDRGMEEAVREQYALGRKGEGLIVIVEPQSAEPSHATSTLMQWFEHAFSWF